MLQYVFVQIPHVSAGAFAMERAQQLVSNDGLQSPLPFMVQYGLHPGSEVTVELDDVIRLVPKLSDQTDSENRK